MHQELRHTPLMLNHTTFPDRRAKVSRMTVRVRGGVTFVEKMVELVMDRRALAPGAIVAINVFSELELGVQQRYISRCLKYGRRYCFSGNFARSARAVF